MNKDNLKRAGQALVAGSLLYGGLLAGGKVARAMNTKILEANPGSTYVLDVDAQGKTQKPVTNESLVKSLLTLADKAKAQGLTAEAKAIRQTAIKLMMMTDEDGK